MKWKHGAAVNGKSTKEYNAWRQMNYRCATKTCPAYSYYGGRGISVCERWRKSFVNFLEDMGYCPPGFTIDRIDNDGNYEPCNCRWVTRKEQTLNRRCTITLCVDGILKTIAEWSGCTKIPPNVIYTRFRKYGWPEKDCVTRPLGSRVKPCGCKGMAHPQHKLTDEQVLEIRQLHESIGTRGVCDRFNIAMTTARHIIARETWTHLS